MRFLAALGLAAVVTLGFNFATSFDAEAAKKKRMTKNYCPPMVVVRR